MLYYQYEMQRMALSPLRMFATNALSMLETPHNPLRLTPAGRLASAALNHFEHNTRQFSKPAFGHTCTTIAGKSVAITEEITAHWLWGDLLRFRREATRPNDPKLLIVAPMSGHFATLLRGTVKAFLPDHDTYITDWRDSRAVPVTQAGFDLDDYIDTVMDFLRVLGPDTHVIAVCQPAVPVLAAASLMNAMSDPAAPRSMTLIGGPIDTREAPTQVNLFAKKRSIEWFRHNTIYRVPFGNPGFMRRVYPGFLQLAGFMAMNLDRHMEAHSQMFSHLVDGDGESLVSKRRFYEEYRAVMDLPAEYYLQTIAAVFQEHLLPKGELVSRGRQVDPAAIERTALLTIEGERDDISGIGQTRAAHKLVRNLPQAMRQHHEQDGVGHYGLFNGKRFQSDVAPLIKTFIATHR
ncbi:MAG: polyhydroxyalkanoate depolymerase [Acetobacteraceae bacterium]|nr:polyhydroxyalkanoate depolymerase [Acetobacteraceae bacterium]